MLEMDVGDDRSIVRVYLMLQNCTLRNGYRGKFYVVVFFLGKFYVYFTT